MADYVRVADKETGHHLSITKRRYDAAPQLWRELKSPATYADGTPRPAKFKTTVEEKASARQAASSVNPGDS